MKRALAIARRDLASLFVAPVAYVVGVMFLAVQGFSFWAVATVLADPRQSVGYGAVLSTHFGGTILFWTVLFAVVAVISMRLCADERKQGTWETLFTTTVSEFEVVFGKWLAGFAFYAFLWLPTLLFPLALVAFSPPEVAIDVGPIATAYLGVFLCGAAFLAIGVAVSTSTEMQLLAAVATFSILLGLLFLGQLDDLGASQSFGHRILDPLNLRRAMESFSRGAVPLAAVVFLLGLTALGLTCAEAIAIFGRRPGRVIRARLTTVALIATLAALLLVLSSGMRELDLSRTGQNTLGNTTRVSLQKLELPLEMVLIRPSSEAFDPVFVEVERLIERMARAQPRIKLSEIDSALQPERVAALATEFALSSNDVTEGGAVLLESRGRRRVVELLDMAEFGKDSIGAGAMVSFRAEGALVRAINELSGTEPVTLCYSTGHGELLMHSDSGANWDRLSQDLSREGFDLQEAAKITPERLKTCEVVMVLGPMRPFAGDEALAMGAYLKGGGRLFLALASQPEASRPEDAFPKTGLEAVLGEYQLGTPAAIVLDPTHEVGIPLTWMTSEGYGRHPIAQNFQGRRLTVWLAPRAVVGGEPLVRASQVGWGERDIAAIAAGHDVSADAADILDGPPVAVARSQGNTRIVVFGSVRSLSSLLVDRGMSGAEVLSCASLSWLSGRTVTTDVPNKRLEHIRLVMTAGQRRLLFAVCVLLLPLALALIGGVVFIFRRR